MNTGIEYFYNGIFQGSCNTEFSSINYTRTCMYNELIMSDYNKCSNIGDVKNVYKYMSLTQNNYMS